MSTRLNIRTVLLGLLLFVTVFLRLAGLGYSHFYGDETKSLYTRKDVAASDFLLNQRKGPVQFGTAWFAEKVSGGFDEFHIRLPFALAGILSVFVFYFLVKNLFDWRIATISAFLLGLNGFYVAFSRTAQYQSFLVLFGFLAIYCAGGYLKAETKRQQLLSLIFSSFFLGLAFLSHYDAVFFAIPTLFLITKGLREKTLELKGALKSVVLSLLPFILPAAILLVAFYLPYILKGYFEQHTLNYILKRASGHNYQPNNSFYTALVYNPTFVGLIPLLLVPFAFIKGLNWKRVLLVGWFSIPFILFEFIFSNPGTHIHNYLIPLFVLTALGIVNVVNLIRGRGLKLAVVYGFLAIVILHFLINAYVYIPQFKANHPWGNTNFGPIIIPAANQDYQLFLYGFPYNRGWDQVRNHLFAQDGIRNVYTNDNATTAEYYLYRYDISEPGANFYPQYYVYVFDGQEFKYPTEEFLTNYTQEKEFLVNGEVTSVLYKRKNAAAPVKR